MLGNELDSSGSYIKMSFDAPLDVVFKPQHEHFQGYYITVQQVEIRVGNIYERSFESISGFYCLL